MKTRIILDIEMGRVDRDLLNKIGLRVVKELTKAKASLLGIKTEELKEEEVYIDFFDKSLQGSDCVQRVYPDFKTINNGFIDDCIKILKRR